MVRHEIPSRPLLIYNVRRNERPRYVPNVLNKTPQECSLLTIKSDVLVPEEGHALNLENLPRALV